MPVTPQMPAAIGADGEAVSGREFAQPAQQGPRRRHHGMQAQMMVQGHRVEAGIDATGGEQRLTGGGKAQRLTRLAVIQRLDAHAVTRQKQGARLRVPDREGKHAVQIAGTVLAPVGIGLENHLAVPVGKELVAQGDQLLLQLRVVVDGAIENQHQAEFAVDQRLIGTLGQVDDRQPAMPQCNRRIEVVPRRIRPAALEPRHHRLDGLLIRGRFVQAKFTAYATHVSGSCG